jgi:hypothetical protein
MSLYSFFNVRSSSDTRQKESSSQSGKDQLLLNKSMMVVHISSWIIKVYAPCLLLMGDTLRNILLDRVSMQFFLSISSMHFLIFIKKCFTKYGLICPTSMAFPLLLTKLVSSGFHWETWPWTGKVPTDLAGSKATLTQAYGLHQRETKGASWILIWADSRSSGFIMPSTFSDWEEC